MERKCICTEDGMLQHLAGKSHRKATQLALGSMSLRACAVPRAEACQAHGEPEPLILCKDLVCDQAVPLQRRGVPSHNAVLFAGLRRVPLAGSAPRRRPGAVPWRVVVFRRAQQSALT